MAFMPRACQTAKEWLVISKNEVLTRWIELAAKTEALAQRLLAEAERIEQHDPRIGVKLSGLAVLCRTLKNFAAMRLLLENEMLVEARTMVRCCYENLFWIGGLVSKGRTFLEQMAADNDITSKVIGNELLAWDKAHPPNYDRQDEFEAYVEELNRMPKAQKIGLKTEAEKAGLKEAYIVYRMLSRDAAHPSAVTTLGRHVREEEDGGLALSDSSMWLDSTEDVDTWELGCSSLIAACDGVNELLGSANESEVKALYHNGRRQQG
jgi:Family of unknown function (DUF5677)